MCSAACLAWAVLAMGKVKKKSERILKIVASATFMISAVIIALDRCEKSDQGVSIVKEIEGLGVKVISLLTFFDLVKYLEVTKNANLADALKSHYDKFGAID